ncbi:LOW QUALITY PROTEIN: uncharacterized protein LOC128359525 [Scomber scombrus]|uniref:LOW QUALITY PROTEIN: uncharacterized protein LOC128359525 n=1 Tax=Scomber scombrus TaxID=13677 RepID=A0AAV1QCB1_SCOSC
MTSSGDALSWGNFSRFQRYLRLTGAQFEDLLSGVGARISRLDTNYRRSIPAAERLSICLSYTSLSLPGSQTSCVCLDVVTSDLCPPSREAADRGTSE